MLNELLYKAGDVVTISIPGIKAFETKVVAYDDEDEDDGLPWLVELPDDLYSEELEYQLEKMEETCYYSCDDLKGFSKGRLNDHVGQLPFNNYGYIWLKEKFISQDPIAQACLKIKNEIYGENKPKKKTVKKEKKVKPRAGWRILPLKKDK